MKTETIKPNCCRLKDGWAPALEYDNGGVVIAAIRYGTMNEALNEASEMLGCMSDYPDAFTNNHPAPNQMIDLPNDQGEAREELAEEIKFHHRTHSELVQIQCQMQDVIRERDEARGQRDRLLAALKDWSEIREWLEMDSYIKGYMKARAGFFNGLDEALQSLTPNSHE